MDDIEYDIALCMGNPPWEKNQDRDFFRRVVRSTKFKDGSVIDFIMNASFLIGDNGKPFREFMLARGSVEKITIFLPNSFTNSSNNEEIGKIGCRIYFVKGKKQIDDVILDRIINKDGCFTRTIITFTADNTILYFGEEFKDIYTKFTHGDKCLKILEYGNDESYKPNGTPNLKFSKCSNVNHIGKDHVKYCDIVGTHVISPLQIDYTGVVDYNGTQGSEKRVIEVSPKQLHLLDNIQYHMQTRLFGLMYLQISVSIRIISKVLEMLLSTVLDDKFNNVQEYEKALYEKLQLTPTEISAIDNLGVRYSPSVAVSSRSNIVIAQLHRNTDRVKQTGEVFTSEKLVYDGIDLMHETKIMYETKKLIVEPSCGEGAFVLEWIRVRKQKGLSDLNNIKNILAFDIMPDNIKLVKQKIFNIIERTPEIEKIVEENIRCGDFNKWDFNNRQFVYESMFIS